MATLVLGLGNPGGEYAHTRHNIGWRCLDDIERRGRFGRSRREGPTRVTEGAVEGFELVLGRPTTFMNLSGRAAVHLLRRFSVSVPDLIVVHDELDLPVGRVRIKRGGGHAGNRGVQSVIESLQSPDFVRVRVGIGRPPAGIEGADHVLSGFPPEERPAVDDSVVRAADAVLLAVRAGVEAAMVEVNRR